MEDQEICGCGRIETRKTRMQEDGNTDDADDTDMGCWILDTRFVLTSFI